MKLSFYPRGDSSPVWPNKGKGDFAHAGRTYDDKTRAFVVNDEPFEVQSHDGRNEMTIEALHFRALCARDGDVLAADKATAEFCGVAFVKPEKIDGGWELSKPKAPKSETLKVAS